MITFAQFTEIVEQLAPLKYAYEWYNSGVQAHVHDEVSKVLVCLDMTKDTLREAKEKGCDTILAHHPVLFRQVKNLEKNHVVTGLIVDAVRNGINVYSAHTSFDCAPGGINDLLAEKLGLVDTEVFAEERELEEKMAQVVVFAPQDCEDEVKHAMAEAGAGSLGNYSGAAFTTYGMGEFTPEAGAQPYIGEIGAHETVREMRIEMVCPMEKAAAVAGAARAAHCYEEPSIQVYPLVMPVKKIGLGVIGRPEREMTLRELAEDVKSRTGGIVRICRLPEEKMSGKALKVAQIGGAGGEFSWLAAKMGCQALITGEAKYNHFIDAAAAGVLLIEAGHFETESCFVEGMIKGLQQKSDMLQYNLTLFASEKGVRPYDEV